MWNVYIFLNNKQKVIRLENFMLYVRELTMFDRDAITLVM